MTREASLQRQINRLHERWARAGSGRVRRLIEHRIEALQGRLGALRGAQAAKKRGGGLKVAVRAGYIAVGAEIGLFLLGLAVIGFAMPAIGAWIQGVK